METDYSNSTDINLFSKLNRKNIDDRRLDTLIGLSKGLTADGIINQPEAKVLLTWLIQNKGTGHPIILNLLQKLEAMLEDGALDNDESSELLILLQKISGDYSELGEIAKPTALPLDDPPPPVVFEGTSFLMTGTFAFGTRKQCHSIIMDRGGVPAKRVTRTLNYLVLGSYVTDSWAHENFGRKIEKAMTYKQEGSPIVIVSEQHWLSAAGI